MPAIRGIFVGGLCFSLLSCEPFLATGPERFALTLHSCSSQVSTSEPVVIRYRVTTSSSDFIFRVLVFEGTNQLASREHSGTEVEDTLEIMITQPGTHHLSVEARGEFAFTGSEHCAVVVSEPVIPGAPNAPTVSATATPSSGDGPLLVTFSANSQAAEGRSIVEYAWDFEDDESWDLVTGGDVSTASRFFFQPGLYTVRLRATDDGTPPAEGFAFTLITVYPVITLLDVFNLYDGQYILSEQRTFNYSLNGPEGTVVTASVDGSLFYSRTHARNEFQGSVTLQALPLGQHIVRVEARAPGPTGPNSVRQRTLTIFVQ